MSTSLLNNAIEVSVSEPWEFGTECGDKPFRGRVTDAADDALLVRLDVPLRYQGKQLVAAVVRPRHVGERTDALIQTRRLIANILLLTRDVATLAALSPTEPGVPVIGSANLP